MESTYDNGQLHGKQRTFNNLDLMSEGEYVNNAKSGTWQFFNESGEKIREEVYAEGKSPKIKKFKK